MLRETKIDLDKWESLMLSHPTKDGREYYIWSTDFGFFKKKDAEIISSFLRNNFIKIIQKVRK